MTSKKDRKKLACKPRHRLCSIVYDVETRLRPLVQALNQHGWNEQHTQPIPLLANERCGSWYTYPFHLDALQSLSSCYFKSTDGHARMWHVSLKRLNLRLIELLSQQQQQQQAGSDAWQPGVILVDASVRKVLPDSMSKTIPIWAAVINALVLRYRGEGIGGRSYDAQPSHESAPWDTSLHVPAHAVAEEERCAIGNLLDQRVEEMYTSGVIIDREWLVRSMRKPLRCVWLPPDISGDGISTFLQEEACRSNRNADTSGDSHANSFRSFQAHLNELRRRYYVLLCINASDRNDRHRWLNLDDPHVGQKFVYLPGSADDHESWSSSPHFSPNLFWANKVELLSLRGSRDDDNGDLDTSQRAVGGSKQQAGATRNDNSNVTHAPLQSQNQTGNTEGIDDNSTRNGTHDDQTEQRLQRLIQTYLRRRQSGSAEFDSNMARGSSASGWNAVGKTRLAIGSRRAGRPPECWNQFSAILNVTTTEYEGIHDSHNNDNRQSKGSSGSENGADRKAQASTEPPAESSSPSALTTKPEIAAAKREQNETVSRYYLQLLVEEGKRDKMGLEKWLTVGIVFCVTHLLSLAHQQRAQVRPLSDAPIVLIHCAQGKDRSVAVAMAVVLIFAKLDSFPLRWDWELMELVARNWIGNRDVNVAVTDQAAANADGNAVDDLAECDGCDPQSRSGLSADFVERLKGHEGRDLLLDWVSVARRHRHRLHHRHHQLSAPSRPFQLHSEVTHKAGIIEDSAPASAAIKSIPSNSESGDDDKETRINSEDAPFASKEHIRVVLHWIRQDREHAEPTRSTLQKLNRYFLSRSHEDSRE